ncbi:hypothetical protein B566_EDAN015973 [Ephemera danica]|nr:hypothetical protein B566_EDAN015973 [Ephemera danica]
MAAGRDQRQPVLSEYDWNFFLTNGRPTCSNSCVIWCEAYFDNGELFVFRQENHAQSADAERLALLRLRDEENKRRRYRTTLRKVHFYVSYSPCLMCSYEIIQFASDRREFLQMKIIFTACYLLMDQRHRQGLEACSEQTPHLRISTATTSDWQHLAKLRKDRRPLEEIETDAGKFLHSHVL